MTPTLSALPAELLFQILDLSRPDGFESLALSCRALYDQAKSLIPKHNICRRKVRELADLHCERELRRCGSPEMYHRGFSTILDLFSFLLWLNAASSATEDPPWTELIRYISNVVISGFSLPDHRTRARLEGVKTLLQRDDYLRQLTITSCSAVCTTLGNGMKGRTSSSSGSRRARVKQDIGAITKQCDLDTITRVFNETSTDSAIGALGMLWNLQTLCLISNRGWLLPVDQLLTVLQEPTRLPGLHLICIKTIPALDLQDFAVFLRCKSLDTLILHQHRRLHMVPGVRSDIHEGSFTESALRRLCLICPQWEFEAVLSLVKHLLNLRNLIWIHHVTRTVDDPVRTRLSVFPPWRQYDRPSVSPTSSREAVSANTSLLATRDLAMSSYVVRRIDDQEDVNHFTPMLVIQQLSEYNANTLVQLAIGQADHRTPSMQAQDTYVPSSIASKVNSFRGLHRLAHLEVQFDFIAPHNPSSRSPAQISQVLPKSMKELALRVEWGDFDVAIEWLSGLLDSVSDLPTLSLVKFFCYGQPGPSPDDALTREVSILHELSDDLNSVGIRLVWLPGSDGRFLAIGHMLGWEGEEIQYPAVPDRYV